LDGVGMCVTGGGLGAGCGNFLIGAHVCFGGAVRTVFVIAGLSGLEAKNKKQRGGKGSERGRPTNFALASSWARSPKESPTRTAVLRSCVDGSMHVVISLARPLQEITLALICEYIGPSGFGSKVGPVALAS
jgi:hypothetical protein